MTTETTAATEAALDIDAIKSLLDGFDPTALLPDVSTMVGRITLLCRLAVIIGPVVLLALGLSYLFLSPKEANYYLGYRCYFGMGSTQAWRFSQRIAGLVFSGMGLILMMIMLVVSAGFSGMETMDMAWCALRCLLWEVGLSLLATLAVNIACMVFFDAKGAPRKLPRKA